MSIPLQLLILVLVTLMPFFELRAGIPLGILRGSVDLPFGLTLSGFGLPWYTVFFIVVLTNIVLGILIYLLIKEFIHLLTKIKVFSKLYNNYSKRVYKSINKYVDRYGEWGLMVFIAVPLPGSGSYSGALAAHLIGLSFRKFIIANTLGVIIAGIIVTLSSLGLLNIF